MHPARRLPLALVLAMSTLVVPRVQAQQPAIPQPSPLPPNQPVTYRYSDNDGFGSITLTDLGPDTGTGGHILRVSIVQNGFQFDGSGLTYPLPNEPRPLNNLITFTVQAPGGVPYFFQGKMGLGVEFQGSGTFHPVSDPTQSAPWGLLFTPGTRQSYSSAATLVVAEIVQRLSGKKTIREFVRKEVIEPLGLSSTGLGSQGFARERLVRATVPDYQKKDPEGSWNSKYWQEFGSPAGGLFSTPEDFAVICALMLGGGKVGDVRLVSPATVRMMTSNRLDDLPDLPEPVRRTQPWGLGWRLNHPGTPDSWGDLLGRQVFGHTGATGTMVWMDRRRQGFAVLLTSALREKAPWRLVHLSNAVAAAFV